VTAELAPILIVI